MMQQPAGEGGWTHLTGILQRINGSIRGPRCSGGTEKRDFLIWSFFRKTMTAAFIRYVCAVKRDEESLLFNPGA